MDVVDVAIVGGGLSGLVCAREILRARKETKLVVLEASHRVGGRMFGRDVNGTFFDLGGQWIGPGQTRIEALVKDLGIATEPTPHAGIHLYGAVGNVARYKGTIPKMGSLSALFGIGVATAKTYGMSMRVPLDDPESWEKTARLARWDERTVEEALSGALRPEARAAFDAAFRTVFGAEARDVSLLWYLFYVRAGGGFFKLVDVEGGAQERRFVGGAFGVPLAIARELGDEVVKRNAAVSRLEQKDEVVHVTFGDANGANVKATTSTLRAKRVVVAAPPSIVHRSIEIDPPMPAARHDLCANMRMGATVKMLALYKHAFWRDTGLSGQAATDGLISVVFDNTSIDGKQPALVGFIVGDVARAWSSRTEDARQAAVIDQLVSLFGEKAKTELAELITYDWSAEEWTGGCPVDSPTGSGALAKGARLLREPHGLIHWAGTETATKNPGYLDGAVAAGERAAREVVGALSSTAQ